MLASTSLCNAPTGAMTAGVTKGSVIRYQPQQCTKNSASSMLRSHDGKMHDQVGPGQKQGFLNWYSWIKGRALDPAEPNMRHRSNCSQYFGALGFLTSSRLPRLEQNLTSQQEISNALAVRGNM